MTRKTRTHGTEPKVEDKSSKGTAKCEDTKCLLHNKGLRMHGARFEAIVVSDKMQKSAVVEIPFYRIISKYRRYEKRKTRITVHNPGCISAKSKDKVLIAECRPLSKTKSFIIVEKLIK